MIYRYYWRFDTRKNWARDIYARPLVELINFKYCKRDISSLTKCVITELQFICFAARWNTRISRRSTFVSNFESKFILLATNFLGFLFFYSKHIRNTFENKTLENWFLFLITYWKWQLFAQNNSREFYSRDVSWLDRCRSLNWILLLRKNFKMFHFFFRNRMKILFLT